MIIDISREIHSGMAVYKNKPEKKPSIQERITASGMRESIFTMDSHTGTHVDAPLHLGKGKTVADIPMDKFISPCTVLDFTGIQDRITEALLKSKKISNGYFILLKTDNSSDQSNTNFVYLDISGAEFLLSKKITGIGIDALGIERDQPGHPTHRVLLNAGIIILEGLDLSQAEEGDYYLHWAPLRIKSDAAPVRAWITR